MSSTNAKGVIPLAVTESCVGCGNCEAICPKDAVHTNTGIANLVEAACIAFDGEPHSNGMPKCLVCVLYCPVPGAFVVNSVKSDRDSHV